MAERSWNDEAATARRGLAAALIALASAACGASPAPERPGQAPSSAAPAPARPGQAPSSAAPATPPPPPAAPAAWRQESSLGVQISVPAHWAVNDYGCGLSDRPTAVRGQGAQRQCLTPEKPTKEVAEIGLDAPGAVGADPAFARREVSLGGVSAERIEGRGADGRYFGWLRIPSRKILISVRTHDPEVTRRILDSAQLATVDHNGCPDRRPPSRRPEATHPSAPSALSPASPTSIAVCYYGEHGDALQSSARLTGAEAAALAAVLNQAPAGPNPDADPKMCLHPPAPPPADALLIVEDAAGRGTIYVSFSGCVGRGLDNGARRAQVGASLIKMVMDPLHTGYAFHGDLNGR
ncbi:hypothetical protein [Sorangium sp. So ce124]|uniref:hypothetical protein n=1 Tax=Sorangium sp. So ce124 TaxID=3133280 RepID=UPI003F603055